MSGPVNLNKEVSRTSSSYDLNSIALSEKPFFKEMTKLAQENIKKIFLRKEEYWCKLWLKIFQRVYVTQRLQVFCNEFFDRLRVSEIDEQEPINKLMKIFESSEDVIDVFLHLVTTHRVSYYSYKELSIIIKEFYYLVYGMGEDVRFPSSKNKVPPYDQGGKEWLSHAKASLSKFQPIKEQVEMPRRRLRAVVAPTRRATDR